MLMGFKVKKRGDNVCKCSRLGEKIEKLQSLSVIKQNKS